MEFLRRLTAAEHLLLTTPFGPNWSSVPRFHVRHYNPAELERLLALAGWIGPADWYFQAATIGPVFGPLGLEDDYPREAITMAVSVQRA